MEARWWWCSAATAYLWRHRPPWGVVPAINTISLYPVTVCYCWRSYVKNFTLSRCRSAGFTRSDFQRKKKNKREREKKKSIIFRVTVAHVPEGFVCKSMTKESIMTQLRLWTLETFLSRSILIGSSHTRELEKAVNEPKHMKSIPILWKQEKKTFTA